MLTPRDIFALAKSGVMGLTKWDLVLKLCEDVALRIANEEYFPIFLCPPFDPKIYRIPFTSSFLSLMILF